MLFVPLSPRLTLRRLVSWIVDVYTSACRIQLPIYMSFRVAKDTNTAD